MVFDMVPYWPGPLSQLLALASEAHPGWQIINLVPSSWWSAAEWLNRDYFNEYSFARGQLYWGARFYAVRRSEELEEWAAGVARCAVDEVLSHTRACHTRLRASADHSLYAFVSLALATALPLLTIDRVRSVRSPDTLAAARHFGRACRPRRGATSRSSTKTCGTSNGVTKPRPPLLSSSPSPLLPSSPPPDAQWQAEECVR